MAGTALCGDADETSRRVVEAVASAVGADPVALTPPLYEVVDLDALDTLVQQEATVRVAFQYDGHDVVVDGDGTIAVDGDVEELG